MSSTYSPNLRIQLMGTGDQAGTWGTTTNVNLGGIIENAISGYTNVNVISTDQAFTYAYGLSDLSANQSGAAVVHIASATSNSNVYAPPNPKTYIVFNDTAYSIIIYNSTAIGNTTPSGFGVTIPAGQTILVYSNGSSFYAVNSLTATTATTATTANALNTANNYTVTGFTTTGNTQINGNLSVTGAALFLQSSTTGTSPSITFGTNTSFSNYNVLQVGNTLTYQYQPAASSPTTIASLSSTGVFNATSLTASSSVVTPSIGNNTAGGSLSFRSNNTVNATLDQYGNFIANYGIQTSELTTSSTLNGVNVSNGGAIILQNSTNSSFVTLSYDGTYFYSNKAFYCTSVVTPSIGNNTAGGSLSLRSNNTTNATLDQYGNFIANVAIQTPQITTSSGSTGITVSNGGSLILENSTNSSYASLQYDGTYFSSSKAFYCTYNIRGAAFIDNTFRVTSGSSITCGNDTGTIFIDFTPSGTFTVVFPANPVSGQKFSVGTYSSTVTFAATPGAGSSYIGGVPSTITPTTPAQWTYYSGTGAWFRSG